MNTFFFTKDNIRLEDSSIIKDEIGIIENQSLDSYQVYLVRADKRISLSRVDFNNSFELFNFDETGDAFPKKVCNVCTRLLDTEEFDINQHGKNNRQVRRPSCVDCRRVIDGVSVSSRDRRIWARRKPNLVPFTCPICLKTTIPGLTSKVVLDHDHDSGRVRGWICDSCNTGLGRFKDDVELLKSAINYLETI
ncbi:endonuclease VII domain-containing protein [Chloroflexota bacterium]